MEKLITDICIVGAGPGGSSAALLLARKGIPCLLLDKEFFPRDKICGDGLSGKVVNALKRLDPELFNKIAGSPIQLPSYGVKFIAPNFKTLSVPYKNNFSQSDPAPGFISRRIDFDNFLVEELRKHSLIKLMEGENISGYEKTSQGYLLKSNNKSLEIQAKLLLIADGAQSSFAREFAGIKIEPRHYSAGVRAYYKGVLGMDENNFIELHFLKELLPGYFWIFPLRNGFANVGLVLRSDRVSKRKVNLREELKRIVNNYPHIKKRFDKAELAGEIKGFGLPLGSKRRKISGDNFMLIGDAASLIDPFTGEGISHAMVSGMHAAEHAIRCLEENNFSQVFMARYDREVYSSLGKELDISTYMQRLLDYPWLFNFIADKAARNKEFASLLSCMFDDLEMRKRLKNPFFYFKLLFG